MASQLLPWCVNAAGFRLRGPTSLAVGAYLHGARPHHVAAPAIHRLWISRPNCPLSVDNGLRSIDPPGTLPGRSTRHGWGKLAGGGLGGHQLCWLGDDVDESAVAHHRDG